MKREIKDNIGDDGFTLMELVVVLMLFALVATFSLQAMTGTLRFRDSLAGLDDDTKDVTQMLSLLRSDLTDAVPLLFFSPGGQSSSAIEIAPSQDQIAMSVSGNFDLAGQSTAGFARVIWRFKSGSNQITRQVWPVLIPASSDLASPEVVISNDITGMSFRTLSAVSGWISGGEPDASSGRSNALPRAIEITVETARFGRLNTLVSYP